MEAGESDRDALARELEEKVGIVIEVGELSMSVSHEYDRYHLDMQVYCATTVDQPIPKEVYTVRWVAPAEFEAYAFPSADQQTVDALLGE